MELQAWKSILLPKQTHPACSSRFLKSRLGAVPPLERGLHPGRSSFSLKFKLGAATPLKRGIIEISIQYSVFSSFWNSPLERGASSTCFKNLEEAGCVCREPALGLEKRLKLVPSKTKLLKILSVKVLCKSVAKNR
jgi:hypothetical protein